MLTTEQQKTVRQYRPIAHGAVKMLPRWSRRILGGYESTCSEADLILCELVEEDSYDSNFGVPYKTYIGSTVRQRLYRRAQTALRKEARRQRAYMKVARSEVIYLGMTHEVSRIERVLLTLPEKQRGIVTRLCIDEVSLPKQAEEAKVSYVGNIRESWRRAILNIKRVMSFYGDE